MLSKEICPLRYIKNGLSDVESLIVHQLMNVNRT